MKSKYISFPSSRIAFVAFFSCFLLNLPHLLIAQTHVTKASNNKTHITGNVSLLVNGDWLNAGHMLPGGSTLILNGAANQQVQQNTGAFYNLTINKSAGEAQLISNITIEGTLKLLNADIALDGQIITLDPIASLSETPGNTVKGATGHITTTQTLPYLGGLDVGGLGLEITSTASFGATQFVRGHAPQNVDGGPGINRYFQLTPSLDIGFNSEFVFKYDESELNGITETDLQLFHSEDGGNNWSVVPFASLNLINNTVTVFGMENLSRLTLGTCANDINAVCDDIIINLDANGQATITASDVDAGSTGQCGIMQRDLNQSSFTCADLGTNNVTLTILDAIYDSKNCISRVTVQDKIIPNAVCKTHTIEIQSDGYYALTETDVFDAVNSYDNCGISDVSFIATTYSCDEIGTQFQVPVMVTDGSGNSSNCNALITVAEGDNIPSEWEADNIGTFTSNNYTYDPCAINHTSVGEFTITGSGNNSTSTNTDNIAFAYQTLCSDGSITAKIEDITPNGYGGLSIRESTDNGAKQVSIYSNLSNILRHEVRYTTNAPKQIGSFFKPSPSWLRLDRQGDWIFAYSSSDGVNFQYVHGVFLSMQECVEIGMASFTYQPGQQTNATFSNVITTGNISTANSGSTFLSSEINLTSEPVSTNDEQFIIFPNPSYQSFSLLLEQAPEEDITFELYNAQGQLVSKRSLNKGTMKLKWDATQLDAGLYRVFDTKHLINKPIIIHKP